MLTRKGLSHALEIKGKRVRSIFRQLERDYEHINLVIATGILTRSTVEEVRQEYASWLTLFNTLYDARDEYLQLVEEPSLSVFKEEIEEQDKVLLSIKTAIEEYILEQSTSHTMSEHSKKSKHASKKSTSVRSGNSSHSSNVSSAKLHEKQKQVELEARKRALKEKQRLEQAKLDIQIKEEELELQTQIEVCQAKSKVLNDFESDQNSVESDKGSVRRKSVVDDLSSFDPVIERKPELNIEDTSLNARNSTFLPSRRYSQPQDIIVSVVQQLRKPVPDIQKFSGNPLEYQKFMRQFRTKIVANTSSEDELMCYLEQFTIGEAHQVVRSFSYLDARDGYHAAMDELKVRYGNQEIIANTLIKRAMGWPNIKPDNVRALDEYAVFLNECQNAVRDLHAVKVLEYPDNIRKLAMKLPFHCQEKWRSLVLHLRQSRAGVEFSDLAQFVRTEALKATDPMYGKEAMKPDIKPQLPYRKPAPKQNATFGTDLVKENKFEKKPMNSFPPRPQDNSNRKCTYCDKFGHQLASCQVLASKPNRERIDFLKSLGLCFRCLDRGHRSIECSKNVKCQRCGGNHATLLHIDHNSSLKTVSACTGQASEVMEAGEISSECTLAVIPVQVSFRDSLKIVTTYAFLDPGSTVSFCSESLMNKLGCYGKSRKVEITIDTLGEPHTSNVHAISGLKLHGMDLQNTVDLPTVYTRTKIPVTRRHIPKDSDYKNWPHLDGVQVSTLESGVDLLIGGNVPDTYSPLEVKVGPPGSPHASRTRLGWILWNVVRPSHPQSEIGNHPSMRTEILTVRTIEESDNLDTMVRKSINMDFSERSIDDKAELSQEDKMFLKKVNESISFQDGHYHIDLPFRNSDVKVPNNSSQALKRLDSLKKRFLKDKKFKEDYQTFMKDILTKNYAEKVPMEDLDGEAGHVWFIPHHGVYHPRKPGKIRVVFDCAASYQGLSLNDMLLQGPNLTNNLVGILLRFRQDSIAIMGDIESMYYRVRVPRKDRDYLRFYWWPDGDCSKEPEVYRMCVHLFGAVSSSSCSTFALQRTAEDNEGKYDPEIVSMIKDNFYVDDCLASTKDEDSAIVVIKELSQLCQDGGFRLTKWASNSKSVMMSIPVEERVKDVKELNLEFESLPNERALGVFWFVDSDSVGFKIQNKDRANTRRGILSVVSSVYDPLGLASPYILIAKQLLQNLCKLNLGWDEEIDKSSMKVWLQWLKDLPKLESLQFERCFKPKGFGKIKSAQLHVFSDASEVGYGVSAYLRLTNNDDHIHCVLVMAKSRVAPLKKMTIPRMELTAATVAVRLSKVILQELQYKIDKTFFWTDSMSVIRYISNSTSRFKTFVANRLTTIHEGSDVSQWNHVTSKSNPADCASRGMTFDKLNQTRMWFKGPLFLWKPQGEWPKSNSQSRLLDDDPEVRKQENCFMTTSSMDTMDKLLAYYSSWTKLCKAVAWMILITRELKRRMNKENRKKQIPQITVALLKDAENSLIKYVQGQHFPTEMELLKRRKDLEITRKEISKSSSLYKLDPFVEDGIIRVGGRLDRMQMEYEPKHPVVLPKSSPLSTLLLEEAHRSVGHMGRNAILANIRQRYWILGAGTLVKSIVSRCVTCRKYRSPTCQQQMASLPTDRLQPDKPPFSHVGIDYFGPFMVKRGRSDVKRYGVVFSCLTMRAVHIELACSLDTDSCINAIRRFIARRGTPEVIRSDNGTNLTGSERELREEIHNMNQYKLHSTLLQKGIDWHFNPPAASHHGGSWERMIRSIRKVMNAVMKEQPVRLDDESLGTLFCEVEMILNGRPLTDVPCQPHDLSPITPNHLLLLHPGQRMPPGVFCKDDVYSQRRWRQVQYLADVFWRRWLKEYLPLQQERSKWTARRRNVEVDDVVLLVDSSPRNSWSLGRVIEVMTDKKGFVRVARVKTATTELIRPIDKLCILVQCSDGTIREKEEMK